jgi:hypothetical protein
MSRLLKIYIFLIASACAHTAREDHGQFLRRLQEQEPTAQIQAPKDRETRVLQSLWAQYIRANSLKISDPQTACHLFFQLSEMENFKLKQVALLRALSVCDVQFPPLKDIEVSYDNFRDSYLADEALAALISWHERKGDKEVLIDLYYQRSRGQTLQSEKLESMDKALKLAKEFKQTDKIVQFEKRIETLAPRRKKNPKWEELHEVAQDYRHARMFPEVISP